VNQVKTAVGEHQTLALPPELSPELDGSFERQDVFDAHRFESEDLL
jgi:hypothetical protein